MYRCVRVILTNFPNVLSANQKIWLHLICILGGWICYNDIGWFVVCCCCCCCCCCWLLVVGCCLLFVVCCLLFVVCWLLFVVCCLLFVVCCLLFVVCCLLLLLLLSWSFFLLDGCWMLVVVVKTHQMEVAWAAGFELPSFLTGSRAWRSQLPWGNGTSRVIKLPIFFGGIPGILGIWNWTISNRTIIYRNWHLVIFCEFQDAYLYRICIRAHVYVYMFVYMDIHKDMYMVTHVYTCTYTHRQFAPIYVIIIYYVPGTNHINAQNSAFQAFALWFIF